MEDKMDKNAALSNLRNSVWPSVKPFVNGGLAQVLPLSIGYSCAYLYYKFNIYPHLWLTLSQRMQFTLFHRGMSVGTLLGSYELLTRKVGALNEGCPLTLYQDASCGLVAGAIRACICYPLAEPIGTGFAQPATNKYDCFRHFSTITWVVRTEGVLALWKGACPVRVPATIASNAGMLVSYDRFRMYLKETHGLSEGNARLGAGIFSGLCTGACYISVFYAATISRIIRSYRVEFPHRLFLALRALKPGGGFNFYSELGKECVYRSPAVMIMWVFLEAVRDAEESTGL